MRKLFKPPTFLKIHGVLSKLNKYNKLFQVKEFNEAIHMKKTIIECKEDNHNHNHSHNNSHNHNDTLEIKTLVDYASDLLPHQAIIENFVHHNPLEDLEHLKFKSAIDYVRSRELYMSPGERVFFIVNIDPRKRANEAMVDLCAPFLDKGAAKWTAKYRDKGFLYFFAFHEVLGFARWREHARVSAKKLIPQFNDLINQSKEIYNEKERDEFYKKNKEQMAEQIIKENFEYFGLHREEYTEALRAMMLDLKGWAGMFKRMEHHQNEQPENADVTLLEFCAVQTILYRASMEALAYKSGFWNKNKIEFRKFLEQAPRKRNKNEVHEHSIHPSAIAYIDQNTEEIEQLEEVFEKTLLHAVGNNPVPSDKPFKPFLQVYTCIDDRECSIRRHIEEEDPQQIETFGVAGFFGIPIKYKPIDGREIMILAPEGQNPTEVLVEKPIHGEKALKRVKGLAKFALMWENMSFSPFGSLILSLFSPITYSRLFLMGYCPNIKKAITEKFKKVALPKIDTDFNLPFSPEHAAKLLARTFKDTGTHNRFANIIIILGHGAKSVNNPFAAAYNCGACGGREGGPNARLLARLANNQQVRECLRKEHGVYIPEETVFIGGMRNTTNDTVVYYDYDNLSEAQIKEFSKAKSIIDKALGFNALERCGRFLLAQGITTPEQALKHVDRRSSDAAEVRPELNHATNAAVIVGRRELTKGHFLDRRVFLPSYDPFFDDERGTNLEHVLTPALFVCSGINLEYFFSTVNDEVYGAGTKAPLNIMSNIGVTQGTIGDLRTGLPSQMTEMHTPVRSLFVVESPIDRIEAVLSRNKRLLNLVRNEWVRLFVRDPVTGQLFRQKNGKYIPYHFSHEENTTFDTHKSIYSTSENNKKISSKSEVAVGDYVPFTKHYDHGKHIAQKEKIIYYVAAAGMVASLVIPGFLFSMTSMNPRGLLIALGGTALSLPVLSFSRRYLHGEFMFARIAFLSAGLLFGFNLVALAPNIHYIINGWGLFGFASTFLIGAYNERHTVRNGAIFAFGCYRISDFAILVSAALLLHNPLPGYESPIVAAGLVIAAIFKSSQFPLTALFVRSMEGPTPTSALGYAGLSAHAGLVLLTSTLPFWFSFDLARVAVGGIGLITAIKATFVSKIRSDRKGALANATSGTIGILFIILALGYSDLALILSFGHAAFRMTQILRAPNMIADTKRIQAALGKAPWPRVVPDWLYQICWRLRRVGTDLHFFDLLNRTGKIVFTIKKRKLTKQQQWIITTISVILAGIPSPFSHFFEEHLLEIIPTDPLAAILVMFTQWCVSVLLIRYLFIGVLDNRRFKSIKGIWFRHKEKQEKILNMRNNNTEITKKIGKDTTTNNSITNNTQKAQENKNEF